MRIRLAVAAISLAALVSAQQSPTIRVPVRLVSVPTLVFSKAGQLIPNLQRSDFQVFDNGRLQEVALDTGSTPVSIVLAVQMNQDVRAYVPFIAKAGAAVETLLVGETGEAAVIAYSGDIAIVKPFDTGDVQSALGNISADGAQSRMIDAGVRAVALLKERPSPRTRILLFIGQPMDNGSEFSLAALRAQAERENVSIFALALPEIGKAFVSDTFSLGGVSQAEKGGFKAGVDLGNLARVLRGSGNVKAGADPFSVLTAATGGTQLHFRKPKELEDAIAAIGGTTQCVSAELLSQRNGSRLPRHQCQS